MRPFYTFSANFPLDLTHALTYNRTVIPLMPTITLPVPVHELLAVLSQATTQGMDIREALMESVKREILITSDNYSNRG